MRRNGLIGGSAPNYSRLSSLYDAIVGPPPFLNGLAPRVRSRPGEFLSGLGGPPSSGGFLSGLAPSPPKRLPPPPSVIVADYGVNYTFNVYPITHRPRREKSVYIFGKDQRWMFYAGIAENTFDRLSNHERMAEAMAMGANEVWVHTPGPDAIFNYKDAERRLIERHCFSMNKQHNPLADYIRDWRS